MSGRLCLAALALTFTSVSPAAGQASAPKGPPRPWELTGGVTWVAPATLGTNSADLLAPDGSSLSLFRTRQEAGSGLGFEVLLGTPVSKSLAVEFGGNWTHFDARSVISGDLENVANLTIAETLTRFSVDGAVLWTFADGTRADWFVRGGVGWMRELSSDKALAQDGTLVNAGVGVKYWLGGTAVAPGRFGLRAEFRVMTRRGGIDIDDGSFRFWPVVAGSAVVKF